jgi:4-hydroxy-2-oxoheptanedioate aldolase
MRPRSTLDELLAQPGQVLGTWTQIANADLIDALGAAGYDFTIIDTEHGAFGIETAESLIRACEAAGVVPLVRVPRDDTTSIYKALDAGAVGVLVPAVESVAQAQTAVDAAAFAPGGTRGACPIVRAADHSAMPWQDFASRQSANGVLVMIETATGVDRCEAICAVQGLKALVIGPFDLSVSLGQGGDVQAAPVQQAVQRLLAAARAAALPALMPVFSADEALLAADIGRWSASGIRHFAIGADKIIVSTAFARYRSAATGGPPLTERL